MRKKRTVKRGTGSLARNVVWFCVSVTILICASLLFHRIIQWPDLPLKEVLGKESSKVALRSVSDAKPQNGQTGPSRKVSKDDDTEASGEPQAASAAPYDYSFYHILSQPRKGPDRREPSQYAVQLGAFKSREQALAFRDDLKESRKLDCRVVRKGAWHVVLWGNFSTKKAAERVNRQIERKLGRDCLVVDLG